jgi:uncharacterized 2Fe-2S/4Fe-4S cluster protein (DUF4445 family)
MGDKDNNAMVIFQPSGRRGEVPKGTNVLEASRLLGADIEALCGEKKVCGKCKVRIEEGRFEKYGIESKRTNVSAWQEEEEKFIFPKEKETGHRLACVTEIQGDLLVFVPEESRAGKQVVSKAARDIHIDHNPTIKIYTVEVEPPTFEEPTADFERVCRVLEKEHGLKDLAVDIFALRQLPTALRDGDWSVTVSVWNDREVVGLHDESPVQIWRGRHGADHLSHDLYRWSAANERRHHRGTQLAGRSGHPEHLSSQEEKEEKER